MKSAEYISNVLKTESANFHAIWKRLDNVDLIRLLHAGLGMVTESGEFIDSIKKHIFYGKELDLVNLKEELGDQLFYIAVALNVLGTNFEEIMKQNINKLRARYGDKFTEEKAINRDLDTERKILENYNME